MDRAKHRVPLGEGQSRPSLWEKIKAEVLLPPMREGPGNHAVAHTLFHGGPILTLKDAAPSADAVAVKHGKILAIGLSGDVLKTRGVAPNMGEPRWDTGRAPRLDPRKDISIPMRRATPTPTPRANNTRQLTGTRISQRQGKILRPGCRWGMTAPCKVPPDGTPWILFPTRPNGPA